MALVEFECHGPVALIRFNRADQRNAVTTAMKNEIQAALERLEGDDALRVAVLTGAARCSAPAWISAPSRLGNVRG